MPGDFGYTPEGYQPSYDVDRSSYNQATQDAANPEDYTIKQLYPMVVQMEDPESIRKSAQAWTSLAQLLQTQRDTLVRRGEALQDDWDSDASRAYLTRVGQTSWSLQQWQQAAEQNSRTLDDLAGMIETYQTAMTQLWRDYEQRTAELQDDDENGGFFGLELEDIGDNRHEENLRHYTQRALDEVVNPLMTEYAVASARLSEAPAFTGPTDAPVPSDAAMAGAYGLTPPGTPRAPGAPGAPGAP
ncbi:WXG100 family type VII secretion target, partial [Klenkia sp. PcliD-1-E]|uniref:WXG100 family type VII secretion target n=1 Tax=Klenkia sp. PcliD-1-E TaxID=2954492 RepID=UPI002097086F